MNAQELDSKIRQRALEERCKEGLALYQGRFVVSEANKEIVNWMLRTVETMAYGEPKTPPRAHHHGEDDGIGLPSAAQQREERERALSKLSPTERRALGLG